MTYLHRVYKINPFHDKAGRFSSKDKGEVYSSGGQVRGAGVVRGHDDAESTLNSLKSGVMKGFTESANAKGRFEKEFDSPEAAKSKEREIEGALVSSGFKKDGKDQDGRKILAKGEGVVYLHSSGKRVIVEADSAASIRRT